MDVEKTKFETQLRATASGGEERKRGETIAHTLYTLPYVMDIDIDIKEVYEFRRSHVTWKRDGIDDGRVAINSIRKCLPILL